MKAAVVCVLALLSIAARPAASSSSSCEGTGPVSTHNCAEGSPRSEWNLNAAADRFAAFTSKQSYACGEDVHVMSSHFLGEGFDVRVYRLGHYGGLGAKLMGKGVPFYSTSPDISGSKSATKVGSWLIPQDAPSGLYMALLQFPPDPLDAAISTGPSHIAADHLDHAKHPREHNGAQAFFTVRPNPSTKLDVLYRVGDAVWGVSATGDNRSFTFLADQINARNDPSTSVFSVDVPAIKFIESLGLEVGYITAVDMHKSCVDISTLLQGARIYVQAVSEEARSREMRSCLRGLASRGVHRAFLGIGGAPKRMTWNDEDFHGFRVEDLEAQSDEDTDTGSRWAFLQWHAKPMTAADPSHKLWLHTKVARFSVTMPLHRQVIGRRVGEAHPATARLQTTLSSTPLDWSVRPSALGLRHVENASHSMVLQRDAYSGALTFHANTDQFTHGLDAYRDHLSSPLTSPIGVLQRRVHVERDPLGADAALQQLMINLFGLMGVMPRRVPVGFQVGAPSTDRNPPTCDFVHAKLSTDKSQVLVEVTTDDAEGIVTDVMVRFQMHATFTPLKKVLNNKAQQQQQQQQPTARASNWVGVLPAPPQLLPEHRLECFATDDSVNTNFMPAVTTISNDAEPNGDL